MKRVIFLVVAILMGGLNAVIAKINYVPLSIVDTQTDVNVTRKSRSVPLFITQNGYRLELPLDGNVMTFMVLKDNDCVYEEACQPTLFLPDTLVGNFEVRLCAETYYYQGFLSLGSLNESNYGEDIILLGSNTSQQAILENVMELHVVEYNKKLEGEIPDEYLCYLSEEEKDAYNKKKEEAGQRRIGLLDEELAEVLPQIVVKLQNGKYEIHILDLIPVLISCIQELKIQLDSRVEKIVDIMMACSTSSSEVSAVRAAIGNILFSVSPTSVNEPTKVQYILTNDVTKAHLTITDISGRVLAKVPLSTYETSVTIDKSILDEGVFLCKLYANDANIDTKCLVKLK